MKLTEVLKGHSTIVTGIGEDLSIRRKLMAFGIIPGSLTRVLQSNNKNLILLSVMNRGVIIEKTIAQNITVSHIK